MLERVDRVQLVVKDRQAAARTFAEVLGAQPVREAPSAYLGAARLVLALGSSEVELCEPSGPGPAAEHLSAQGEGLMTAGFSTRDMAALQANLDRHGCRFTSEGAQVYLEPSETLGMRVVLSPDAARPRRAREPPLRGDQHAHLRLARGGRPLHADLRPRPVAVLADQERTLRLRRHAGLVQPEGSPRPHRDLAGDQLQVGHGALGRQRGDSLYMCYVETDDVRPIIERLAARGAASRPAAQTPQPSATGSGSTRPRSAAFSSASRARRSAGSGRASPPASRRGR